MHRTECSFQQLHERIAYLEQQCNVQEPTDEQVERVLRKILADKFSAPDVQAPQSLHSHRNGGYFVENPKGPPCPQPIPFDPASLVTEPDSVPSKRYMETVQMLENNLMQFPHLIRGSGAQNQVNGVKRDVEIKKPRGSDSD